MEYIFIQFNITDIYVEFENIKTKEKFSIEKKILKMATRKN